MRRGEIYVVDLGPGVGREVSGVHPVVVVSNDVVNVAPLLVLVVPAVDATEITAVVGVPVTAAESGLPGDFSVLARQPRTLDPSRFPDFPAGAVPDQLLKRISDLLRVELDL